MKRISILIVGLMLTLTSFCQKSQEIIVINNNNSVQTSVEKELNYAADLYSSAATSYIVGTSLILTSYYLDYINPNQNIDDRKLTKDILYGVGGGIIVIGALCQLSAGVHLRTAGTILDIQATRDGVGVKFIIR